MSDNVTQEQIYAILDRCVDTDNAENFNGSGRSLFDLPSAEVALDMYYTGDLPDDLTQDQFSQAATFVRDWQRERRPR